MSRQPAAVSERGPARTSRASGVAANAAIGTTDTVSAAVAGERRQPSTRSRTSRNSAAVSAAESSTSATFGAIAGRCRSGGCDAACRGIASAAGTASTATGTCTTKIDCQEMASVSRPPATGPAAVPITPAAIQRATPRRSSVAATSSSRQPTRANAPPSACTQRAAISTSIEPASAHAAEAAANTAMPAAHSGAGSRRDADPRGGHDDHARARG